ncbi:MAG: hypothetical protein N2747_01120 [Chitinophagaceae bacterium]|nr:hypothetical protein [Chitinophagaceae bacterium]
MLHEICLQKNFGKNSANYALFLVCQGLSSSFSLLSSSPLPYRVRIHFRACGVMFFLCAITRFFVGGLIHQKFLSDVFHAASHLTSFAFRAGQPFRAGA